MRMRLPWRGLCAVVGIWIWVGCMIGCAKLPMADLSYADKAFSVNVKGTLCRTQAVAVADEGLITGVDGVGAPMELAATVAMGAPDSKGRRDMRVAFTAPAALSGMTLTRCVGENGEMTTTLARGDLTVTITDDTYDGLWLVARACLPIGDVADVSPMTAGGQTVTLTGDGVEQVLVFSAEAGKGDLPVEVGLQVTGYRVQVRVHN